jgi:hypothetical protein
MKAMQTVVVVLAAVLFSGCSALLPKGSTSTPTEWQSYEDAKTVLDTIQPKVTTRTDLKAKNIDPYKTSGVTILSYADVLSRFNVASLMQGDAGEKELTACLRAGKRCTGYSIVQKVIKRDRTGNFFMDSLQFQQDTDTTGWSVNALILFVDDTVVYVLVGGQPVIRETDVVKRPLGFLQGWGGVVGGMATSNVTK